MEIFALIISFISIFISSGLLIWSVLKEREFRKIDLVFGKTILSDLPSKLHIFERSREKQDGDDCQKLLMEIQSGLEYFRYSHEKKFEVLKDYMMKIDENFIEFRNQFEPFYMNKVRNDLGKLIKVIYK